MTQDKIKKVCKIECDTDNNIKIVYYKNGEESGIIEHKFNDLTTEKALRVDYKDGSIDLYYFEEENGPQVLKRHRYNVDYELTKVDIIGLAKENKSAAILKDITDEPDESSIKELLDGLANKVDKKEALKKIEDLRAAKQQEQEKQPKAEVVMNYQISIFAENHKFYITAGEIKREIPSAVVVTYNYTDGIRYRKYYFDDGELKLEYKKKTTETEPFEFEIEITDVQEPSVFSQVTLKSGETLEQAVDKVIKTLIVESKSEIKFANEEGSLTITSGTNFKKDNILADNLGKQEYQFTTEDGKKYILRKEEGIRNYAIYEDGQDAKVTAINSPFKDGEFVPLSQKAESATQAAKKTLKSKIKFKIKDDGALEVTCPPFKASLSLDELQENPYYFKTADSKQYKLVRDQKDLYSVYLLDGKQETEVLKISSPFMEGRFRNPYDQNVPQQPKEQDKVAENVSQQQPKGQDKVAENVPQQPKGQDKVKDFVKKFFDDEKKVFTGFWSTKATRTGARERFVESLTAALKEDKQITSTIEGLPAEQQQEYANKLLCAFANVEFNGDKGAIFMKNDRASTWQTIIDFFTSAFRAILNPDYSIMDNFFKKNPQVIVTDQEKLNKFMNEVTEQDVNKGRSKLDAVMVGMKPSFAKEPRTLVMNVGKKVGTLKYSLEFKEDGTMHIHCTKAAETTEAKTDLYERFLICEKDGKLVIAHAVSGDDWQTISSIKEIFKATKISYLDESNGKHQPYEATLKVANIDNKPPVYEILWEIGKTSHISTKDFMDAIEKYESEAKTGSFTDRVTQASQQQAAQR